MIFDFNKKIQTVINCAYELASVEEEFRKLQYIESDELDKITCAEKHFAEIGMHDYAKSTPDDWRA